MGSEDERVERQRDGGGKEEIEGEEREKGSIRRED